MTLLSQPLGIAATGHVETSQAAAEILRSGGNAFDAAIGALCAACVAEPLLVSLGGGGFLLSRTSAGQAGVHDFFCQTPARRKPEADMDFFPILANFGTDTQEFHVGMGAVAVPGLVAGIFGVHRDLCRMPLAEIMQPAIELARRGVRIDALHHYIVRILETILRADDTVFALFESPAVRGELISEGEYFRIPVLADAFETLAQEGEELFYTGDWGRELAAHSEHRGGNLTGADLRTYRVERREPLPFSYRNARCMINPPPSPGGCLIAFALALLEGGLTPGSAWGGKEHVQALAQAFHSTSEARLQSEKDSSPLEQLLGVESLEKWRARLQWHTRFSRGTTHISVADGEGNIASLTASNGEGNTYVLPGTGIILNNMLGEEDLNPGGFHRWRENTRLASMMSPVIAQFPDGSLLALGTGGSNRIRSAIVQVLVNLLDFDQSLAQAVLSPRLHLEGEKLSIEAGYAPDVVESLRENIPGIHQWPAHNLFFGGVHAVRIRPDGSFEGAGDPRRDGAVAIA